MATSKTKKDGYRCPVRGCPQKNNRSFSSVHGVVQHIAKQHGIEEVEKRLRVKRSWR